MYFSSPWTTMHGSWMPCSDWFHNIFCFKWQLLQTRTHAGKGFERPHALLSKSLARIHVFDFCAWIMKRNNHSSCDSSIKWLMMQTIIVMQIQAGTSYLAGTCFACDRVGSRQNLFVCVWSMDHNCSLMFFFMTLNHQMTIVAKAQIHAGTVLF